MDQQAHNQIETLLRLFEKHRLEELIVEEGEFKLHLRRDLDNSRGAATARRRPRVPPAPTEGPGARTLAVRSPLTGVFYRSPAPDAPPLVQVGDAVEEGQTVCLVEAMKVFNEIKAELRGTVVAVPAANGGLVQAGDPLVVLELPSQD